MNRVEELLFESKALLEGHFLLSSGRHSDKYVQCAKLLQYPDKAAEVLKIVCNKISGFGADLIVGPAMGGIIVAYEIGRQLGIPAIFTERIEGEMSLRRGFEIYEGQKVIISEDVVTTGKSSLETVKVIESFGGEVVGIACVVDRKTSKINIPIYSCIEMEIESYEKSECPMCKLGIDYVKPGSRNIK